MAHGITATDNMFSVREKPWHGLGTMLDEVATAQEALHAASLDWRVEKIPVRYSIAGKTYQYDRQYVAVRSDTNDAIGLIGEDYVPLQNTEAFHFFDKVVQDPNGPKYVTAGSLHGGKKVWILAKMPSFIEVTGSDVVEEYLLLSNTHDGSRKIEMMWTPIRVVCQNTLSMALGGKNAANKVRMKHTGNLGDKIDDVRGLLGIADQNHKMLQESIDVMKGKTLTSEEVDETLASLFKPFVNKEATPQILTTRARVKNLFESSEANTLEGIEGTGWAFYNAITEWADHDKVSMARVRDDADARVESNWFGKSANFKTQAFDTVMELCSK